MLPALLILVALTLIAVLALLLRRPPASPPADPRLLELSSALPAHLARLEASTTARLDTLDAALRSTVTTVHSDLADLRRDAAADAQTHRDALNQSALQLRDEVTRILLHLGSTLTTHLAEHRDQAASTLGAHRSDTSTAAEALRYAVKQDLDAISQRLTHFIDSSGRHQAESRDALHTRLTELGAAQAAHQESLRFAVEQRLDHLNTTNSSKLEEMRATVDEKLQRTLHTRLTDSFSQVATHLGEVQKGLGEMKELATGVGDLKKVLSNVKSRGVVGEFQLGLQLEQMFSPEQYVKNARIKRGSLESVEFALKFPGGEGEPTLLPIDAKFPREDWERLEHAYEHGTAEEINAAGKQFERSIRAEGKRICDKYIDPPTTLPHAIMFLPTESLYAEVVRRPGLQSEIQQQCRVTIAGPSTFMAILTSFQMGFHTIAIEKRGSEVWNVLTRVKDEFTKFGGLMEKVEKNVGTVQNTLKLINGKTTTINRTLSKVGSLETGTPNATLTFDTAASGPAHSAGIAPLLAAVSDPLTDPQADPDET